VVHIVSLSGSNEGNAVLSSMSKGDGLSFGSIDRMDLGWVLEVADKHIDGNNPLIPFVDKGCYGSTTVFLRACGSDTYLLSDIPEGGMMATGDRTLPPRGEGDPANWQISLCGEDDGAEDDITKGPFCSGAQITIRALAQASDNNYRDERLLSDGEEGGPFRFGGPTSSQDNRWKLLKINNYADEIGAVKNLSCIHLGSVAQPGTVLLSDMGHESAPSWGGPDQRQDTLGWRIRAIGTNDRGDNQVYKNINVLTIRYGMRVTLESCACGGGMFFGSDMEIGKFKNVMDPQMVFRTGWFIQGGKEGAAVHIGDAILLQQATVNGNEYLHSIDKDGVFHFGGDAPELGWRVGSVGKDNGWAAPDLTKWPYVGDEPP